MSDFFYEGKGQNKKRMIKKYIELKKEGLKLGYFNSLDLGNIHKLGPFSSKTEQCLMKFELLVNSELALKTLDFETYTELTLQHFETKHDTSTHIYVKENFDVCAGLFLRLVTVLSYFESKNFESLKLPEASTSILKAYGIFKIDPTTVSFSTDHIQRIAALFGNLSRDIRISELTMFKVIHLVYYRAGFVDRKPMKS